MTFGQPLWFWAFVLLPVMFVLFLQTESRRGRMLRQLVAARLQDRLAGTVSAAKRRLRFALVLLGVACVILSLTQPRIGYTWEQSKRTGRDVLIAMDVSKSMLATDLKPDRLTRAKLAAQDLIAQLQGDRIGLVAFAGSAFLQAPLTADFGAVMESLKELDTEIIPRGGSNLAEALRISVEAFGKGESDHRALIIFSDGEELDADGMKAANKLKGVVRIFTVGIGSPEGSLLPVPGASGGTEFVKDERGQFVKSRLDAERLRKIAEATGGFYVHLQSGLPEMTQIVRDGLGNMTEKDIDAKMSRQPIERYQWPLAAGLLLLASSMMIGERRRASGKVKPLAAALAIGLAWLPVCEAAQSPHEMYEQGRFADAQKGYEELLKRDPKSEILAFNLGAAAYKNNDLDTALKAFSQASTAEEATLRAKAEYNLANTLFQKGSPKMEEKALRDALAHYDQALKLTPADESAQHNKKVTEDLLAKLKEQQEQQKKDDQKKDKKDQQKDEKKEKDEQKKDQQKGAEEKDQEQSGDQKKDEQSKGSEGEKDDPKSGDGQKKDEQKPGESKEEQEGKDGQQPDEKKDGKEGDAKEPKDGSEKGDSKQEQAQNSGDGEEKSQDKPAPMPGREENKGEGELKANATESKQDEAQQQEAAAEAVAAAEGKMTERQAKALLDSLKNEDERVQLTDPAERKRGGVVRRDW